MLSIQCFHTAQECLFQVLFCDGQTLDLLKSACLLLSLGSSDLKSLVFGLNSGYFSLNLLFPTVTFLGLAFVGAVLETADLVEFGFLFHLKQSLLNSF